jgi:hypothetical protein
MANYIENDRGEMVIAVGAPGSIERAKVQWPELIRKLDSLFCFASGYELPGKSIDDAVTMISSAGVTTKAEKLAVLNASLYVNEGPGTVAELVRGTLRPSS